MQISTYSKGLILWIDDSININEIERNLWFRLFGENSDQVFRLMDLSLDIASNYLEAKNKIREFDSYHKAGIFVYCILDLTIPKDVQGEPKLQYGIALAKLLLENNISFSILSANTGAEKKLSEEGLSAIPYYSKDFQSKFLLPESLSLKVLSEFRRNITWISVSQTLDLIHPDSAIVTTANLIPDTFKYYPYFGPHRDYVERCEYRSNHDLPKVFSIRSPRSHCDEFIQQALCVLLYQSVLQKADKPLILYGDASNKEYINEVNKEKYRSDSNAIIIIRLYKDFGLGDNITSLLHQAFNRAGKTILVIPNDETSEELSLLLQQEQITTVDELAQSRLGDVSQRDELVKHCCMLSINLFLRKFPITSKSYLLGKGSFLYPELIINPENWRILIEAINTPEELSDAFEIVKEMNLSLDSLSKNQHLSLENLLTRLEPIPYDLLLRVGGSSIKKSNSKSNIPNWFVDTITNWLKHSWQYPNNLNLEDLSDSFILEQDGSEELSIKWQNNSYEILVGLIADYFKNTDHVFKKSIQKDLFTAIQFVQNLGGTHFLGAPIYDIDWSIIENSRWPYRNFPLPAAIVRRFKEAGRYLWIQPEGLDIAVTLPGGRLRYRNLSFLVNRYWSTISWVSSIQTVLPRGWNSSVQLLVELISENQIQSAWANERESVWHALMTILRNGCPVVYITDQIFLKAQISEGKTSAKKSLSTTHGYGSLLGKIRGNRVEKFRDFFSLASIDSQYAHEIKKMVESQRIYELTETLHDQSIKVNTDEIYKIFEEIFHVVQHAYLRRDSSDEVYSPNKFIKDAIGHNMNLLDSEGWYVNPGEDIGTLDDDCLRKGSKADYFWEKLDSLIALNSISYPARYFDGYPFLSMINDIRNKNKDSMKPNIDSSLIETIMEYFLCGIEGILSQLAWCVDCYGESSLASKLYSPWIKVVQPYQLAESRRNELSQLMRIEKTEKDWGLYTLGITGRADRFCYYDGEQPVELLNP